MACQENTLKSKKQTLFWPLNLLPGLTHICSQFRINIYRQYTSNINSQYNINMSSVYTIPICIWYTVSICSRYTDNMCCTTLPDRGHLKSLSILGAVFPGNMNVYTAGSETRNAAMIRQSFRSSFHLKIKGKEANFRLFPNPNFF